MSDERSRTLRALRLGQRLKNMREDARLTLRQVGEYIRRDGSTISRIESGALPARVPEVLAYLDMCGINDTRIRDAMKRLSNSVFEQCWWDSTADNIGDELLDLIWAESLAEEIKVFDVNIPGLLQAPEYMSAIMRVGPGTDEQIRDWISIRTRRQQILHRQSPTRLDVVLDEAALHRVVGEPNIMKGQLQHLIEMLKYPNVNLRVTAFDAGAHVGMGGNFSILDIGASALAAGAIETQVGALIIEGDKVDQLAASYVKIQKDALHPNDSHALINQRIQSL